MPPMPCDPKFQLSLVHVKLSSLGSFESAPVLCHAFTVLLVLADRYYSVAIVNSQIDQA